MQTESKETFKAVKIFTDRVDPQEAFERKLCALNEDWQKKPYVLYYYGTDGIGKTAFINKLCRVINKLEGNESILPSEPFCDYIRYDFSASNAGVDKLTMLLRWRELLQSVNRNLRFVRFDAAIEHYGRKIGKNFKQDSAAQFVPKKYEWFGCCLDGIALSNLQYGNISVAALVEGGKVSFKALDMGKQLIHDFIIKKEYKNELLEIAAMEDTELLNKLHEYFIQDMCENMNDEHITDKPFVIFLDSYEKYQDAINSDLSLIPRDYWLRKGVNSVMQSIPGILWVITGCKRLDWTDDIVFEGELEVEDSFSIMTEDERISLAHMPLEQHLLGNLVYEDATEFLEKAGIHDEQLRKGLYDLTDGIPLYLDVCVDTYNELSSRPGTVTIDDFDENLTNLIGNYLLKMSEDDRKMIYFFACLGTWTRERAKEIAKKTETVKNFTDIQYDALMHHSFIIKNPDGSCYMHDIVRKNAFDNVDAKMQAEVHTILLALLREDIEKGSVFDTYVKLKQYIDILLEADYTYDTYYEHLLFLNDVLTMLFNNGCGVVADSVVKLLEYTRKNFPETDAVLICIVQLADVLCLNRRFKDALKLVSIIDDGQAILRLDEKTLYRVYKNIPEIYYQNEMYEQAIDRAEMLLELCDSAFDQKDVRMLSLKNNLAIYYGGIGDFDENITKLKEVLEIQEKILAEDPSNSEIAMGILVTKYNIAVVLNEDKKHKDAIDLLNDILQEYRETLGEQHPHILSIKDCLAASYFSVGDIEQAFVLQQEVEKAYYELLGEDHPNALHVKHNIGNMYIELGDVDKAIMILGEVLKERSRILGEKHPNTLRTKHCLGVAYSKVKDSKKKAVELLEEVLSDRTQILGKDHPDTCASRGSLNGVKKLMVRDYREMGELQKASTILEEILWSEQQALGENNREVLELKWILANLYSEMKEKD